MIDSLARLFYAGLGALSMTHERAEKIFDECVARGQTDKEHRSAFVKDLMDAAEKARQDTERLIREQVDKAIDRMNLATKEDLARLEAKIDQINPCP